MAISLGPVFSYITSISVFDQYLDKWDDNLTQAVFYAWAICDNVYKLIVIRLKVLGYLISALIVVFRKFFIEE